MVDHRPHYDNRPSYGYTGTGITPPGDVPQTKEKPFYGPLTTLVTFIVMQLVSGYVLPEDVAMSIVLLIEYGVPGVLGWLAGAWATWRIPNKPK